MKLLHFADLHLDTSFRWADPSYARHRRRALEETLKEICRLAVRHQVDALTCGGDLYEHDRFTPHTRDFLQSTFAELSPIRVFLAPGNHDWYGPQSLYSQADWSDNVRVFTTPTLTAVPLTDGITLWGAAHCAPANTPGFLDGFRVDRGGIHIGLFHGSEHGDLGFQGNEKLPHAPFFAEQIREAGLHHALLGHFHRPADHDYHTYPGNPDPLSFGETWKGSAVLVEISDDGTITRTRLLVARSEVNDVRINITGAKHNSDVLERIKQETHDLRGAVRVTLEGELDPEIDLRLTDLKKLRPDHLDEWVIRLGNISIAPTYDLDQLKNEPTVRGQFVRDVLNSDSLTEEQRGRVLRAGLRALDDRIDELEIL